MLTAAGSVIPGFGNVSGFLAGTAIDLIYGKDINKLVDYVADLFDDNKIYVFTCPNCGYSWTRKEEDLIFDSDEDGYTESYSESVCSSEALVEEFKEKFDDFLERVDAAIVNALSTKELTAEMAVEGDAIREVDEATASQYYYLAGLCSLLYAKEHASDPDASEFAVCAEAYLARANSLLPDNEYELMQQAAMSLAAKTPEECVNVGTLDTANYQFPDVTLFEEDWLISIYEYCRFHSMYVADVCATRTDEGQFGDEFYLKLWKPGLKFQDKDYRMYSNVNVARYCTDREDGENVTYEESNALNAVVTTSGYSIDTCDVEDLFDRAWLEGCVYYAESVVEKVNPYVAPHVKGQLSILERISELGDCYPVMLACYALGRYYEKGIGVEKNLAKARMYYQKAGCEKELARLENETSASAESCSLSENEAEYAEEVKVCLENGEISNGERRLLEKLRVKLGISDDRAAEIEASLSDPQLTEAEQEYVDGYNECLRESGVITSGERRLLNKLRITLGISESRAEELEKIN